MIRCVDLEINKVAKSFIGSKEAIKCLRIFNNDIFVAGCDPIIRGFNLQTGDQKMFQGHKSWVYTIEFLGDRMLSGGDDRSIIIWDVKSTKVLETLTGHDNGVTSIALVAGNIYTGSFDHNIICWDLNDLDERI